MRLVWSTRSRLDLLAIEAHVLAESPQSAARVLLRIESAAQLLKAFPKAGSPIEGRPARKLIEPRYRYRLVYEIDEPAGVIRILRVFHPKQSA